MLPLCMCICVLKAMPNRIDDAYIWLVYIVSRFILPKRTKTLMKLRPYCRLSTSIANILLSYLSVDFWYHPFESLTSVPRIRTDRIGQQVFHVVAEWHTVHIDDGFLFEQRFTRLGRMWCVVQHFVNGDVPAEGQVYRFQRHDFFGWVNHRSLAGVADFCGSNYLKIESHKRRMWKLRHIGFNWRVVW